MATTFSLRGVTKVYGEGHAAVRALDGVDLDGAPRKPALLEISVRPNVARARLPRRSPRVRAVRSRATR